MNHCPKITDAGMEVLALACTGLLSVEAQRNLKITDRSVISLLSHCKSLAHLDLSECSSLSVDIPTLSRAVLNKRHVYITWPDYVVSKPAENHPTASIKSTGDGSAMRHLAKMLMGETTGASSRALAVNQPIDSQQLLRSSSANMRF